MAEGYWVSAGFPMIRHWLHPYLVVMRPPLERSWGQNVGFNPYKFVLWRLCAAASREMVGAIVRLHVVTQRCAR